LIFIGSSTESKSLAGALQESLKDELTPVLWSQLGLPLSGSVIDGLEEEIDAADFAAFILAPDDKVEIRGEESKATRDNVLLELGLARGLLGKDRTFLVLPSGRENEFRLPSDIVGLVAATYELAEVNADPDNLKRVLLDAANDIRAEARRHRLRRKPSLQPARRVSRVLGRGSTEVLRELADAAIYVADKRHKYPTNLRRFVRDGDVVPSKYLYWTPEGSEHWLKLCKHKTYQFYRDSLELLRQRAGTIVGEIVKASGSAQIDLVSVGSGDGMKDNALLGQLQKELEDDEFVYYYPVDISDTLIVEAIRNALHGGLPRESFRVKALIADFLNLAQLQAFYEERPAPNLFSVLGNTIGNADEDELFRSVSDAMLPGDLVLLEVNVGKPSIDDPVWRNPVTVEHDFTPLAVLNVEFDPKRMEYSEHDGEGIVEGTKSIVASYKEATIGGQPVKDIRLSIIHYYDYKKFIATVKERMNVEIIWDEASEDVCLVLARRPDDR
jgi:uncharacterized SAM-dependent methyltransferase